MGREAEARASDAVDTCMCSLGLSACCNVLWRLRMAQHDGCKATFAAHSVQASMHGEQVVEELLDVGPVLNAIDVDGCSALHLAAQDGHSAVVRLLKEHGVVDGLPNLAGSSPADLARQHGHVLIVEMLAQGAVSKVRGDDSLSLRACRAKMVITFQNGHYVCRSPLSDPAPV